MKRHSDNPKDHMISLVFPEAIHPLKLRIFTDESSVKCAVGQGNETVGQERVIGIPMMSYSFARL
jgi:hypothetical protein